MLVSVVLPAFNAVNTVARAVESIRAQTLGDWELLVVDDGSADGTRAVLDEFARRDARVRVIGRPHEGLVAALTAGLGMVRGEFVARMDADDVSHPERLAAQIEFLRARPGLGLTSCLVEFGGDRAASAGYALHVDWINSLVSADDIALNRFVESPFAHPSVMFRRELIARLGGYRAGGFPEDYELWLRWLDAGVRMEKLPRTLLTWNDPPTRLSRRDARYAPEAFFRMKAEWVARAVERVRSGRDVFVWGAGRPTRKRAGHLERHGVRIAGYIDVDARKATRAIGGTGAPVIAPADLPSPRERIVLGYVSSRGARDLIRGELESRGYVNGRDFLMCA